MSLLYFKLQIDFLINQCYSSPIFSRDFDLYATDCCIDGKILILTSLYIQYQTNIIIMLITLCVDN